MRRFLICGGLQGDQEALRLLQRTLDVHRPDGVLFVGGILGRETPATGRQEISATDVRFYAQFYEVLGKAGVFAGVIPAPDDAPLREFLRLGMNAEVESPNVHLVHSSVVVGDDFAVCGIGGELTETQDTGDDRIRQSRNVAEYFLRNLWAANPSRKILMLACPPKGQLGGSGPSGEIAGELIDSYHPHICAVAGQTQRRGVQRVAHTTVVNPGRLIDGSAAWFDTGRDRNDQVSMLDLRETAISHGS